MPERESLDENMRGMGDPADYDAWAGETPAPAAEDWDDGDGPDGPGFDERLTELATELAELVGLTIAPADAPEPRQPIAFVDFTCLNCGVLLGLVTLGAPGMATQIPVQHMCHESAGPMPGYAYLAFTATVRSGA